MARAATIIKTTDANVVPVDYEVTLDDFSIVADKHGMRMRYTDNFVYLEDWTTGDFKDFDDVRAKVPLALFAANFRDFIERLKTAQAESEQTP